MGIELSLKLRVFKGCIIILIIIFGTIILNNMTILISIAVSDRWVVVFWQDQPLHHHLTSLLLLHLWQYHVALLFWLDEAIERVMVQVAKLNSSTNSGHFHDQRRITNSALKYDFQQFDKEIADACDSFFTINISKSNLIDKFLHQSINFLFLNDFPQDFLMFGLKSLPENIEYRSFQGIKTSNFFNLPKTRLKVLIHHLIGSSKDLHIEKDDSFDSQFFWC